MLFLRLFLLLMASLFLLHIVYVVIHILRLFNLNHLTLNEPTFARLSDLFLMIALHSLSPLLPTSLQPTLPPHLINPLLHHLIKLPLINFLIFLNNLIE